MPGMAPVASSGYTRDHSHKKSQTPELPMTSWSCTCTLALLVVSGSLTLIVALTRMGRGFSYSHGIQEPARGPDYIRKLDARPVDAPKGEVMRMESPVPTTPPSSSSSTGFFLDISYSSSIMRDSTYAKHLEKKGWTGICAVPFPGDLPGRTCKVVSSPVSGKSGEQVMVEDCSRGQPQSLASFPFIANESPCSSVEATSIGIADLLPKFYSTSVIDSVFLNTNGKELDILSNFPFHKYCARSWTVLHNYDKDNMFSIRHLLEVSHGCRVIEGAGEYFARCPCDKKVASLTSSAAGIASWEYSK